MNTDVLSKIASNPANGREAAKREAGRIPMSVPQSRLAVPEIPGYHTHWMLGNAQRIRQALRAGYDFVKYDEIDAVESGVANDMGGQGSTDMGTNVSLPAGQNDLDGRGNPQDLVLMKIPLELWEADQALIAKRNEDVARNLRGEHLEGSGEEGENYIPTKVDRKKMKNMFTPKEIHSTPL